MSPAPRQDSSSGAGWRGVKGSHVLKGSRSFPPPSLPSKRTRGERGGEGGRDPVHAS